MQTNLQTSHKVEVVTNNVVSIRKLLNIIGIFIFSGLALTNVTNPLSSSEYTKEFLLFISGSAIIYYLLVNTYTVGQIGKKIVLIILILLGCFSIYMVFYVAANSIPH